MKFMYLSVTLAFCCAIAACDDPRPPPDLVKPQREALDNARGLEETIHTQAEDAKKKIDDAEGR